MQLKPLNWDLVFEQSSQKIDMLHQDTQFCMFKTCLLIWILTYDWAIISKHNERRLKIYEQIIGSKSKSDFILSLYCIT